MLSSIPVNKAWAVVNFFEMHTNAEKLWLNGDGDFQTADTPGFVNVVTREEAELAAASLEDPKVIPVADKASPDQLKITVNGLNEQLVAEKGKVEILTAKLEITAQELEAYKNQVGELVEGESEAELEPRAATWLEERRNWMAEVAQLAGKVSDLETENTMIREELDTLRSKQNEQPEK